LPSNASAAARSVARSSGSSCVAGDLNDGQFELQGVGVACWGCSEWYGSSREAV